MRPYPHVLLTEEEVVSACDFLLGESEIVFDLETRGINTGRLDEGGEPLFTDARDPRSNEIVWFGLGCAARNFLIPTGHLKGPVITPAYTDKRDISTVLPPDDPRILTATGKISHRMVDVQHPASYAKPPKQLWPGEVAEIIKPVLFSRSAIIGHHLKFDLETVAKYIGGEIPPGPYHDTLILQHIINENLKVERGVTYSLKDISIDWYRPADPKTWYPQIGKGGIDNYGLDEVARYVAMDLRRCWYLKERLWPRLIRLGLLPAYEFEMSMYPVLMDMEQAGFPINVEAHEAVGAKLVARIAAIEAQCHGIAGGQFPLSNTGIKRWLLFGKGERPEAISGKLVSQNLRPLSYTTKTHTPQLTQSVLDFYADRNTLAGLFREWSGLEKLRGTFIKGLGQFLVGNPPKLHTSFKQHGTVTGRFSAERPNLHQIPKDSEIRELFVPDKGHVLIVADYDQIELRCAGYESRDREMWQVFKRGEDVHRSAAAAMFRVEEVTDAQRAVGKTQNFAVLYGAGPNKIAAVAKCPKVEAKKLIARYYDTFAGLEPWKREVLAEARSRYDANTAPYVTIPISNRIRRLPDLLNYRRDEDHLRYRAERQAINAIVQGFAANITKLAMRELRELLADYDASMLLQVHDEIIISVAEKQADEVLELTHRCMTGIKNGSGGAVLGSLPLIVSVKAGYSWAAGKSK